MLEKNRVWVGFGTALLTSTSLVTGALVTGTQPVMAQPAAVTGSGTHHTGHAPSSDAGPRAGEAGEGGEGGEGMTAADLAESDAAYLTQLGLIRGHLAVGVELYHLGALEASATHMKHPEDELYAALKPALEKRGAPGFEKELDALAERVEQKAGEAEVKAAYAALLAAIAKAESVVPNPSRQEIGEVIYNLISTAAEEYDLAVENCKVVEAHEYQDALGFVRVAQDWLTKLDASGADDAIVAEIRKQIALIQPAWPSAVPPETVSIDPSAIHAAAARIEIATLGLSK